MKEYKIYITMELLKERPDIIHLLEIVASDHAINNYTITEVQTNEKGEGYLGQIFMIKVKDSVTDKKLDVVVKAAFLDEKIRSLLPLRESYVNEIHFYTEVYPTFKNFERDCGVSKSIDLFPKCCKVIPDEGKELICFENLKSLNFENFDKTIPLDDDHISFIFKTYGRFHAYSFALKDQIPEKYARLTIKCENVLLEFLKNPNGGTQRHMKGLSILARDCFVPGEDDEILKNYEKYVGDGTVEILTKIITEKVDHSVILHGDCWSNNMMFKYDTSLKGRKVVDMRLLDMQLIKEGSPVCDLSYCLYTSCAPKEVFDNLDKYLKTYHNSLSSSMQELGADSNKLYPFEVLKQQWKRYSKFGMILSTGVLRMKSTKREDVIDFSDSLSDDNFEEKVANMKFDEEIFKKRIRDLFYHMLEIGAM